MRAGRERRRKDRQRRAAARRLPPVRARGRGGMQTHGRPAPVRMVGVGRFADGVGRRTERRRRGHGLQRLTGVVVGALVALVLVLWIVARLAGHL